jgi:membrane protein DedA with SNARE-associated domain/membrane-associated phospholipid phosphatase
MLAEDGRLGGARVIAGVAEWILSLSGGWALAVVFLGPALEASVFVGIVFPGEIAVILGGVLAYSGRVGLVSVLVAAVLGAIIGDTIGYWVGREWGHRILRWIGRRLPFLKHRVDDDIERGRAFIRRRGGTAVLVGRFAAALRATVPGLAGMSDLHYPTFLAYNAIGGLIWAVSFVLLGYFAGAAWERAATDASRIGLAVLALIVLALVASRIVRNVRERGETLPDRLARIRPVAWFRELHPPTAAWLARRVDTSTPAGFPLSLAVALGALTAWLFGAMIQDIVAGDDAALLDPRVLRFVVEHRTSWLTTAARATAVLGSSVVVIPVVVAAVVAVGRRGRYRTASVVGLAAVAAAAAARATHALVAHARPPLVDRLVAGSGSSFPSTQAAQAAAGWGAVALLVAIAGSRVRVPAAAAAVVAALAIGGAEIYLASAWWTDAIGGLALGAACLCVSAAVVCALRGREPAVE